jgi:hypothetical protein
MLTAFTFAAPWLLLGLLSLPLLWWLLRAVPPAPRLIPFPAIRLLFGLEETEETPHRTPWWLLALRLLLAALLIIGLAHPLINPGTPLEKDGPLVLVIDDSWASANAWDDVQTMTLDLIDQAEHQDLPVLVIGTAADVNGEPPKHQGLTRASDARRRVQAMEPRPWGPDYASAAEALALFNIDGPANVYWLASGVDELPRGVLGGPNPGTGAIAEPDDGRPDGSFARILSRFGQVHLVAPLAHELPIVLKDPILQPGRVTITAERAQTGSASTKIVSAFAQDGRSLAQVELSFETGAANATAALDIPTELRNTISRLAIDGQQNAAAVILVDEQFRRRPVGLVAGGTADDDQPLVGDLYYIDRALAPYAELRRGSVHELLARELAVMILADVGTLTSDETASLGQWIDTGGVLLRFAGPRLAEGGDSLLPVRLRQGGRTFGGVMSWDDPVGLAPFDETSPFAGLGIPADVAIIRQVLAEPGPQLAAKTWARLQDGTPLITAERRGRGWVTLVHTTANTTWSNLSLSGLYVEMLRRILGLSQGVSEFTGDLRLAPLMPLDGFGHFTQPPTIGVSILSSRFGEAVPGPATPPGYYGTDLSRRALNLGPALGQLTPLFGGNGAILPDGFVADTYSRAREIDLKPWLLTAALLLLLADFLIGLFLRGLMPRARRATQKSALGQKGALGTRIGVPLSVLALLVPVFVFGLATPGYTQSVNPGSEPFAIEAAGKVRLAYIRTSIVEADDISEQGLAGLSAVLTARTSIEPAAPVGLDPEIDELAFFPFIYWRIVPGQADLSGRALERINSYLRNGGMILFDTADQQFTSGGTGSPGVAQLRNLVGALDVPPLEPVPAGHVLTKSFYLLQSFPGRWAGGELWVQRSDEHVNDGVSPVIVGSNDFAGAWATDSIGRSVYPVSPGGERQREIALRFGVNIMMYALTGNYKSDQVHVPAILERLGQ